MTYEEMRARLIELRKQMADEGKKFFTDASRTLFLKNPGIQSFGWKQYTPYFNDGDECVFGVHSDESSVSVNGVEGYDVEIGVQFDYNNRDPYNKAKAEKLANHILVAELLSTFEEGDMKTFFGDHVEVTVNRDGEIFVDSYEHG
jgi:hypothetical protein